jgi:hypothetical protein
MGMVLEEQSLKGLQSQNNLKKNFHRHITTSAAGASQQVQ